MEFTGVTVGIPKHIVNVKKLTKASEVSGDVCKVADTLKTGGLSGGHSITFGRRAGPLEISNNLV